VSEALLTGRTAYWDDRPCEGTDLELWYGPADDIALELREQTTEKAFRERAAKAVCADCLVRALCLEAELQHGITEQWGVRGGLTAKERQTLIRQRRAAERQVA
jgi:WhiB family redox-sensing transcriptional regulator